MSAGIDCSHSSVLLNTGSISKITPRKGWTRCFTTWPILNFASRILSIRILQKSQAVALARLGVFGSNKFRQVEEYFRLLPRGIVLHFAFDHDGAGAVGHGGNNLRGEGNL